MGTDLYTKVVLTLIAATLLLLVAQGFGFTRAGQARPSGELQAELGRYRVFGMAGNMLRIDTQTGKAWTTSIRGGTGWTLVEEPTPGAAPVKELAPPPEEPEDAGDRAE